MSESVEDIASNRKLACGTLDSLARVHFPCIPLLLMLYSQKDVCVFFLRIQDVSNRGLPRPAHCSRAVWRSLRGPPGWCSSVRARSAPVSASANVTPGSSRSRMRHATQSGVPPFLSLFSSPWQTPTPQADRGVCGHTISRWPCTGLLMIGESVAGLSRRLRVSFGVESRPPPGPPNCVFLSEKRNTTQPKKSRILTRFQ